MIHLRPDCLVFKLSNGESIPCSAEKVTIELMGDSAELVDQQLIKEAAESVLHYFKTELHRTSVSVDEFSRVLESVLRGLGLQVKSADPETLPMRVVDADLNQLVCESGVGFELSFFPRLREELLRSLDQSPGVLHFRGLRPCVKQLAGAKRWCGRCEAMSDQIIHYMRTLLQEQKQIRSCALVVQ